MATEEVNEIIGSSLPRVTIDKITLENSGGDFTRKNNPHINDGDDTRGLSKLEVIRRSRNSMKVTVTLSVKDVITQDYLSHWFENRDITSLLNVHMVYATSPIATEYILSSNRKLNSMPNHAAGNNLQIRKLSELMGNQLFRNSKTRINSDGDRIYTHEFEYIFSVDNDVDYLAVFCTCRIDLDELFQQAPNTLQVQADIINQLPDDLLSSDLSYNVVIDNGDPVSVIPTYVIQETGETWTGPVHYMASENIWMTGRQHSEDSVVLDQILVPDYKIQDFRIRRYIDERLFGINETRDMISKSLVVQKTNDQVVQEKPKSYFSNIYFSIDSQRQNRFMFSVDYDKIIEDYTLFGGLLRKKGLIDTTPIRSFSSIDSFKIFRKRIEGSSETGSRPIKTVSEVNAEIEVPFDPVVPPKDFDCNEVEQLIVQSSANPDTSAIEEATFSFGGQEIGTIQAESLATQWAISNSDGVRHFTGIDKSISNITDGYYQYRIELEITDRTDEYVIQQLQILINNRDFLQRYYNRITEPRQNSQTVNEVSPHIDYELEGKVINNSAPKATINSLLVNVSINNYIRSLLLFTDDSISSEEDPARPNSIGALRVRLQSLLLSQDEKAVKTVIDLMDTLVTLISDLLKIKEQNSIRDLSSEGRTSFVFQPSGLFNYSKPKVTFTIENTFSNYFDSNTDLSTLYDFMDIDKDAYNSQNGIKVVEDADFITRARREIEKISGVGSIQLLEAGVSSGDLEFEINGQTFNPGDDYRFTDFSYMGLARVVLPDTQFYLIGQSPTVNLNSSEVLQATGRNGQVTRVYYGIPPNSAPTYTEQPSPIPELQLVPTMENKIAPYGVTVRNDLRYLVKRFDTPITDPVNKDNQNCDDPILTSGPNPFSFLKSILDTTDVNSYQIGGPYESTGIAQVNEALKKQRAAQRFPLNAFSPANSFSPPNMFLSNYRTWTPSFLFRGREHPNNLPPSQMWITTTPYHMKSLSKPSTMLQSYQEQLEQASTSEAARSEIDLRFFKINVIEVLTEYKNGQLQKEVWQPLTREIYNAALGLKLICRMKAYNNSIFNVFRDEANEYSTIDTYFILNPQTEQEIVALPDDFKEPSFLTPLNPLFFSGPVEEMTIGDFYVEPDAPRSIQATFSVIPNVLGRFAQSSEETDNRIDVPGMTNATETFDPTTVGFSAQPDDGTPPPSITGQPGNVGGAITADTFRNPDPNDLNRAVAQQQPTATTQGQPGGVGGAVTAQTFNTGNNTNTRAFAVDLSGNSIVPQYAMPISSNTGNQSSQNTTTTTMQATANRFRRGGY